jgi:hypothetical protein
MVPNGNGYAINVTHRLCLLMLRSAILSEQHIHLATRALKRNHDGYSSITGNELSLVPKHVTQQMPARLLADDEWQARPSASPSHH